LQVQSSPAFADRMAPKRGFSRNLRKYVCYRQMYLLILPGLVYFVVFKLGPVWGLAAAFQDFSPYLGILGSKFVWFDKFISLMNVVFFFRFFDASAAETNYNFVNFGTEDVRYTIKDGFLQCAIHCATWSISTR
jgi:putative aldouronate transport system permease protein